MNTLTTFDISHAVDDSDIAFSLRLDRNSAVCPLMGAKGGARHRVSTSLDAFVNLATVNYLLAGLQLCYIPSHPEKSKWFDLLHDLDKERFDRPGKPIGLLDLRYIVRDLIRPFGIVRGSEKQGGQDETGLGAATWPVNFVANLVLDGKERNVVNVWHYHDISAGDDLVLRLKPMPIPARYTLNHYYKRYVQQDFTSYMQHTLGHPRATHVWQLAPDIFDLDSEPENDCNHCRQDGSRRGEMEKDIKMSPGFDVPKDFVWQEHGFWHIGRSQVMSRKYAPCEYYNDDMANMLKVNHMDMTFEPTWTKVPGETRDPTNRRAIVAAFNPVTLDPTRRHDFSGVMPGMMGAEFGRADKRVRWAPELQLESFLNAPMPTMPGMESEPDNGRASGVANPLAALFESPAPRRDEPMGGGGGDELSALFSVAARPAPQRYTGGGGGGDELSALFSLGMPSHDAFEPAPARPWADNADPEQCLGRAWMDDPEPEPEPEPEAEAEERMPDSEPPSAASGASGSAAAARFGALFGGGAAGRARGGGGKKKQQATTPAAAP